MRIILVGQAAFAEKILAGLHAAGHTVAAIYCPPDAPTGKPDPVKASGQALGIAVRQHASLRGPEVQAEFEAVHADLAVLAYVTQIVPPNVFAVPRHGSICFHPSLLPRYRGGSAINWQIIKGERETGVSIFWVDRGIDTGPILLQRRAAIGTDDTAGSLYYNTLFPLGVEAVLEAVRLIDAGAAPRVPQDESRATYDPLCRDEHAAIEWTRPLTEVYNLVRGCDPQPGAYTRWAGERLRLYDGRVVDGDAFRPGVIEAVDADGLLIGGRGGALRVQRVRYAERKLAAAEFAAQCGLAAGQRLG